MDIICDVTEPLQSSPNRQQTHNLSQACKAVSISSNSKTELTAQESPSSKGWSKLAKVLLAYQVPKDISTSKHPGVRGPPQVTAQQEAIEGMFLLAWRRNIFSGTNILDMMDSHWYYYTSLPKVTTWFLEKGLKGSMVLGKRSKRPWKESLSRH